MVTLEALLLLTRTRRIIWFKDVVLKDCHGFCINEIVNRIIVIILLVLGPLIGSAKTDPDSVSTLLLDIKIQIESNQALNDMYNMKFDRAEMQFRWIKQKYDWHPLPYFLLGLSQWWKIIPDVDNKQYDETFHAYMDTSLMLSKKLYKINEIEGAFFLAATYGFVARLESDRGNWRKAALAGKNALSYVDEVRENVDFSPEVLFGDAIMNYYTEWIRDNYPVLKPIMWFFPRGDIEKGISQLKEVAHNAFYTRTEAQYYLMRILANEENRYAEALPIVEYLRETYPDNSYFHRFYMSLLYRMGRHRELEQESLLALSRIDSGMTGYEGVTGRYACFYLGKMTKNKRKIEDSKNYFKRAIEFARLTKDESAWYSVLSSYELGQYYASEDKNLSIKYLNLTIKNSDGKKKHRQRARALLKKVKRSKDRSPKTASSD